jgi:nitrate reductase gamma subunit
MLDSKRLTRATLIGVVLAVLGVVLFLVIYVAMTNAGVAPAPRLFTAMCVPPAVIGIIIGLYALLARRPAPPPQESGPPE